MSLVIDGRELSNVSDTIWVGVTSGRECIVRKNELTIATYFATVFANTGNFINQVIFVITVTFTDEVLEVFWNANEGLDSWSATGASGAR